ncbi:MAG: ImmA/IrrE family metallo-endopeptidase [Sterolibacterium sp.]
MSDCPPEVSLARLVLRDEGFPPGGDLKSLVLRFASIEFTPIPFNADGISVKLKSPDQRPHVIINSDNPPTRQKFTLAHEFGHVLIPWHVGTICSHIDSAPSEDSEYYSQEGEANRFASELLVPTGWVEQVFQSHQDPAETLKEVVFTSKISPQAATIKLMQCLPPGFLCVERNPQAPPQYYRSPGTITAAPYGEERFKQYDQLADKWFSLVLDHNRYRWWYFSQNHSIPTVAIERPWRDVLVDILKHVPDNQRFHAQQSLNGIISVASSRQTLKDAYNYIVCRIRGNDYATYVIDHPDLYPFLIARLKELRHKKVMKT